MTKINDEFGHGIRTKLKMTKINYQFGHGIRFKIKMTTKQLVIYLVIFSCATSTMENYNFYNKFGALNPSVVLNLVNSNTINGII